MSTQLHTQASLQKEGQAHPGVPPRENSAPVGRGVSVINDLTMPSSPQSFSPRLKETRDFLADHLAALSMLPPGIRAHTSVVSGVNACEKFAAAVEAGAYDHVLEVSRQQEKTLALIIKDEQSVRRGIIAALTYLKKESTLLDELEPDGHVSVIEKLKQSISTVSFEKARVGDHEAWHELVGIFTTLYSQGLLTEGLMTDHSSLMARRFGPFLSPHTPVAAGTFMVVSTAAAVMALQCAYLLVPPGSPLTLGLSVGFGVTQVLALTKLINQLRDRDLVPLELRSAYAKTSALFYALSNGTLPPFDVTMEKVLQRHGEVFSKYTTVLLAMKVFGELDPFIVQTIGECRKVGHEPSYPPLDNYFFETAKSEWSEMSPNAPSGDPYVNLMLLLAARHSIKAVTGLKARLDVLDGLRNAVDQSYQQQ